MKPFQLNTIEEAIEDFRQGKFLIVVDDEDRENEGDFVVAAELITEEQINFMLKEGRGVLCAPITLSRCKELDLEMQVQNNTSMLGTPFTVTVTDEDVLLNADLNPASTAASVEGWITVMNLTTSDADFLLTLTR